MKKTVLLVLSIFLSCCSGGAGNNNKPHNDPNAGYKKYLSDLVQAMSDYQPSPNPREGQIVPYFYCDWGTLNGEYYSKEVGWIQIEQVGYNYEHYSSDLGNSDGSYFYNACIDYSDHENDYYHYHASFNESERNQYNAYYADYEYYHGATISDLSRMNVNTTKYDFLYFYKYNDEFNQMVEKLKNCYDYLDDRSKLFLEDDYSPAYDKEDVLSRISWSFAITGNDGTNRFRISSEIVDNFVYEFPFFSSKIERANNKALKLILQYGNRFYRRFVTANPSIDDFFISATSEKSCTQVFAELVNVTSPYKAQYNVLNKDETKTFVQEYIGYVEESTTYNGPNYYDLTMQADATLLYYRETTSNPYMGSTMDFSLHIGRDEIRLINNYVKGSEVEHHEFSVTHATEDGVTTYHIHDVLQNSFVDSVKDYDKESTTTNYSEIVPMINDMKKSYVYGSSTEVLFPFFVKEGDEYKLEDAYSLKADGISYPKQVNYDLHDYRKGCHYLGEVRFTNDYAHYAEVVTDTGEIVISYRLTPIS